ncbi:MAG TPA: gephyrin-like molybdotransferase Glp [Anaerolineales bacterium]|nr:gephyrin-like molybdotransferase Glp [Anaerolineales bacterium]
MLSVSEALTRVLSNFQPLDSEPIPIHSAVGRVLARPVRATLNLPPFPNSSMDGYAVRADDTRLASERVPTALTVVGDVPAGVKPTLHVRPGVAVRVMTGAHLPDGADAVVPIEATGVARSVVNGPPPAQIEIRRSVDRGAYVRFVGEDVQAGEVVMEPGKEVRAYDVGVLAAFGLTEVQVVRRPRVAVLSTGDELVEVDQAPGLGQIRDSNSHSLAALVNKYGGEPIVLGVARDRVEAVSEKLRAAVDGKTDLIVSSAGVSVGAYDVVKAAVEAEGALDFWKVSMRPGKPVAFGNFRGIPFFGLPGNPVSAIVCFELFVRPVLRVMGGRQNVSKPTVDAALTESLQSDGRESYLRAVVTKEGDRYIARSAGGQGSNILSALVNANALVIIPEGMTEVPAGSMVKAWMLDWPEEVF